MKSLSPVQLLTTPWTAAYQSSPSMGFAMDGVGCLAFSKILSNLVWIRKRCPFLIQTSVHHNVSGTPRVMQCTCTALSSGPNPSGIRYTSLPDHLPTLAVVYRDIFFSEHFWHPSLFVFFLFNFWLHWVFVVVWGLSLVAVPGLLIAVVSLVAEHSSRAHRLSGCGTQA